MHVREHTLAFESSHFLPSGLYCCLGQIGKLEGLRAAKRAKNYVLVQCSAVTLAIQ